MGTPTSQRDVETAVTETDAPVIVFENVDLAFDEKVILKNLSFTIRQGHTKIFLGASGAGKSTILKLILGLLKPDAGAIWVKGERVDQLSEDQMMAVRQNLGMVFQEGALFDSLTVRENVGYKLYEETRSAARRGPCAGRGSPRLRRPRRAHRQGAVGAVGRPAAPRGDCPGDDRQAADPALRRADDRPRSHHRRSRIDAEIIKLRDLEDVSTIMVTHQLRDAFYVAEHTRRPRGRRGQAESRPTRPRSPKPSSSCCATATSPSRATSTSCGRPRDPYLKSFLS